MTSKAFGLAQLGNAFSDGALSNRNKILNGAMTIDQRNAGASVTAGVTGAYAVDRWFSNEDTDGVITVEQVEDAPAGFYRSAKVTVTTADATLGASQNSQFRQAIEGNNIVDLNWGSANAATVTVSFWVKSSLTGTFGGSLRNATPDRSYIFQYTISSANTWEQKTVTIVGDTSGTWGAGTGVGIYVTFDLGSGTDRNGTANQWQAGSLFRTSSNTSLISTLSATWQITGVQLEAGDTATPFEHRSYGQELALCQRYFQKHLSTGSLGFFGRGNMPGAGSSIPVPFTFPTVMRASPTVTIIGTWDVSNMTQPFSLGPNPSFPALVADSLGSGDGYVYTGSVGVGFSASSEL